MEEGAPPETRVSHSSGTEQATSAPSPAGAAEEVRCADCGLLLAKKRGYATIEIHWKELQLTAWGRARVRCRKCGRITDI